MKDNGEMFPHQLDPIDSSGLIIPGGSRGDFLHCTRKGRPGHRECKLAKMGGRKTEKKREAGWSFHK